MRIETRARIDAIFKRDPPSPKKFLAGMAKRAKQLDDSFNTKAKRLVQARRALAPSWRKLRKELAADHRAVKGRQELRKLARKTPKLPALRVPKHADRIFSGSVGATVTPPYDLEWTWSQQQGNPQFPVFSADANSGTMSLNALTLDDISAVAMRAAVGNYLIAPLGTSTMKLFAAPAFSWFWEVDVYLNWGESAGWLGFVVESFDREGNFIETIIEQMTTIWDEQRSFLANADGYGSTTGFPLQAQFTAIEGLWYTVWVWFGAYAAEGDAVQAMFSPVSVPFVTWENG